MYGDSSRSEAYKMKKFSSKWEYRGDVNRLDYGGTDCRQITPTLFQFIESINAEDVGLEIEETYLFSLYHVDLAVLTEKDMAEAKRSCGWNEMPNTGRAIAECCYLYGYHAAMGEWVGNNFRKLLRMARREANSLRDDEVHLQKQMARSVNKIGSSAEEYMRGDFFSAMQRGCEEGDPSAQFLAKRHGIPEEVYNNTRPYDFIPYLMGYQDGIANREEKKHEDIAPEYARGYKRGIAVRLGQAKPPEWISNGASPSFPVEWANS